MKLLMIPDNVSDKNAYLSKVKGRLSDYKDFIQQQGGVEKIVINEMVPVKVNVKLKSKSKGIVNNFTLVKVNDTYRIVLSDENTYIDK